MTTPFDAALAGWLGDRLEAPVTIEFLGPVPTGNSNITLPFTAITGGTGDRHELVLRMQVPDNQIFRDADVVREFRVLRALEQAGGVPAPRARWVERDAGVLGHPFFVMDRVGGTVPTGSPSIHAAGWLANRSRAGRQVAWDSAIAAMSAVATVDWRRHAPFLASGASGTTLSVRLDHLTAWYRWVTAGREYPVTDAALAHLRSTVPAERGDPVLCWGDARLGNTMFGADGQVTALLDWELASIGPLGLDLGWWLTFDEFTTHAHGIDPLPGYPGRQATIDRYQHLLGRELPDLRWFEIHCAWVLTVTVIRMADINVAAGRLDPGNRMGHGNLTAQMLARWLDLPVPPLDPAYAARRGLTTDGR